MTTLREIITSRALNPDVKRDTGEDVGDNWETFFANGELDAPITASHEGPTVDWWTTNDVILVDNNYQSWLRPL